MIIGLSSRAMSAMTRARCERCRFGAARGRRGAARLKTRAVEFTTSAAFDAWVAGSKCVPGSKKEGLGGSRIRAKKHPYAYSGIMGDDVIDCACGDNEEYGFMVACETCGVWEHGECCRIQSEEAIPKDYACSTCVRRNEKTVAVLEFSSAEKNGSARTAPTPARRRRETKSKTILSAQSPVSLASFKRTVLSSVVCADVKTVTVITEP